MLLIQTSISVLVEYISVWNDEYAINMACRGQYEKHVAWTVGNVLITGVQVAPNLVLFEFDNFDLKGANGVARGATRKLTELLRESFPVDDSLEASRIYGVRARQVARTLRVLPPVFADTPLDDVAEAEFREYKRKENPDATERELDSAWQSLCQLVEQQTDQRKEQEQRRGMTADDAATAWLKTVVGQETEAQKSEEIGILFLAAEPTDKFHLRLGEELREIQEELQISRMRERFRLEQRLSVRPSDISRAMLDVEPQIVHFSGHGTVTGELCFENQEGETHPIKPGALATLFKQFSDRVSCVVLNACYSEAQAKAIARHIDYVIGMNQAIGDRAAIAFTIGFYQALGAGRTVEEAFRLGCAQIRLQGISEHLTPVLIIRG